MTEDAEDPKDFVDRQGLTCKTYVLTSTPEVHSPSVVRYLLHLYKTGNPKQRRTAFNTMRSFNGLPDDIIRAVLQGRLSYDEEGDKVIIKHANF
jgi:hypothetical protein